MEQVLKVEHKNNTLWATVNRPEAHNAINFDVMDALEQVLDRLEQDDSILTFVLSGADSSFISGGDLKEFHTIETAEEAKPMAKRMLQIYRRLETLPCWTIASINGPAYGGGCETMLAFDFRIAARSATFGFTQSKFYLPPGWGGLTRLVERVGRSTALKWLAEAAVVDTKEALNHNLIDRVVTDNQLTKEAWNWARELSHNDRPFIDNLKQGALRFAHSRWEAIEAELEPFAEFWESEKHQQRVQKFLGRKKQ